MKNTRFLIFPHHLEMPTAFLAHGPRKNRWWAQRALAPGRASLHPPELLLEPHLQDLGLWPHLERGSSLKKSSCNEILRVGHNQHDYVSGLRATLLADRPSPSPTICCPHSVWIFSVIPLFLVDEPQALPVLGPGHLCPPPPALPGLCDECCLHSPLPP